MSVPRAAVEITATSQKLSAGLRAAGAKVESFASSLARKVGGAGISGLGRLAGGVGKVATGALGSAIGNMAPMAVGAIVDAANATRDFERGLVRFGIASGKGAGDLAKFRKGIKEVSSATGIADAEILAGAQAYVGFTGDAEGATKAASMFARVAQATGSSTTDIAQAFSALKTSMDITAKQGEAAFSGLIVQGKGGAVEIKDMAKHLAELAPRFALFRGGKGMDGLRELGAGFQVVMKNAANADDARTKYKAFMESLSSRRTQKELKALGVTIVDNKGALLDASTIFENIAKSDKLFKGTNLAKAFERSEAQMSVLALKEHIQAYRELRDAATDAGAVQRDMNTFLESDAGRIDKAMNQLKLSIAEAFTPDRIAMFADALVNVVGVLGKAAGVAQNLGEFIVGPLKFFEEYGELKRENERNADRRAHFKEQALAGGFSEPEAEAVGYSGVGMEDALVKRIQAQSRGVDWTKDSSGVFGKSDRQTVYSKEELQEFLLASAQRMFQGDGFTNQIQLQNALSEAFKTAQSQQSRPVTVEVGADKIVDGTRKSMANRTRHK